MAEASFSSELRKDKIAPIYVADKMAEDAVFEKSNQTEPNKELNEIFTDANLAHSQQAEKICKPSSADSESKSLSYVQTKMLARVALSDAHFKHQQRGEPDLNLEQKIEIAQNVLDSNKATFIAKFWKYLELEDLEYFQDSRDVYEVDFYMKQVMKNKNRSVQKNIVKNRRYEAMKELISEGEYFSDEEMKFREPYLYEQMIGQYLTQEEIQGKVDKSDLTFSSILLKHIDQLDENVRFGQAKDKEEGQEEEEEESDEEEEMEFENDKTKMENDDDGSKNDEDDTPKISDEQKRELKAEFLTIMQEKFLNGEDKNFDYSKVDTNDTYDDLTVLNADAEEKYFDDEDPESIHSDSSS
ncbi:coiled-coil domain-containing protein 97-like [Mercenaria mercenaria]|uniref:coiled-coil domain-containing protein 97-like n=1 Tax=Mercenaria mercenaria TaxID=6596 RepID=UPI00234F99E5|nr:coiled-coil domain-containing protein 97-like [Mercenaria mercenaria]XP_053393806.1 coiled-coil domain-containing protein 97-like [Mercenaria mercenaria]